MSDRPVVVKLGGDALASPQRIVAQARRLARRAAEGPVLAVASARRGVTDHLLGLAQEVASAAARGAEAGATARRAARSESDRAVATGEVVSAALLALALNELGVPAVSLDAREAGVVSRGEFGDARIRRVATRRLERLLARGIVPVVTGFQGWQRGRVATLGRGGTDTSAVALTVALGGQSTIFVKEAHGLRTADPKLVPEADRIPAAPHAFLSALTAAARGWSRPRRRHWRRPTACRLSSGLSKGRRRTAWWSRERIRSASGPSQHSPAKTPPGSR